MKTSSALRFRPGVERLETRDLPAFLTPMTSHDGGVRVAVGDFNHDGRADVSALQGSTESSRPLSSGGTSDLVVLDTKSNVRVSLGNGDCTFRKPIALKGAKGYYVEWFEASDRNGDGHLDIMVSAAVINATRHTNQGGYTTTVTTYNNVWLGKGDGTFASVSTSVGGTFGWVIPLSNPQSINVDFNRDNITDRASVDGTSDVVVSLGNADGTYQAPRTFAAGSNAGFVTAGDFNGDGWTDIAVVKHQSNSLTVLSNDGNW